MGIKTRAFANGLQYGVMYNGGAVIRKHGFKRGETVNFSTFLQNFTNMIVCAPIEAMHE